MSCTMHAWYEYNREDFDYGYKRGSCYLYRCSNCEEELERYHEEYIQDNG